VIGRLRMISRGFASIRASGELTDLLFGSAGPGVRHDVDRVENSYPPSSCLRHLPEHLVGHFFRDVDQMSMILFCTRSPSVMAAVLVLLSTSMTLSPGVIDQLPFVVRHDQVVRLPMEMPAWSRAGTRRSFRSSQASGRSLESNCR